MEISLRKSFRKSSEKNQGLVWDGGEGRGFGEGFSEGVASASETFVRVWSRNLGRSKMEAGGDVTDGMGKEGFGGE